MVADQCATLARLMADHDISTEPQSLEAAGVRPSQRETALRAKLPIFKGFASPMSAGTSQSSGHYMDVLHMREEKRCPNPAFT